MMDLKLELFKNFMYEHDGRQEKAARKVVPKHHNITLI
jgi:hypothetical protein